MIKKLILICSIIILISSNVISYNADKVSADKLLDNIIANVDNLSKATESRL